MQFESLSIPLQPINNSFTKKHDIQLLMLRIDLIHPHISGNKLFKLKYNLLHAEKEGKKTLLTFGGAFSNHIAAMAVAGKEYGFNTIGIIRGEQHLKLNPTLQFAADCGMQLQYVSRELYKNKEELYAYVDEQFRKENFYLIPEGGANELGIAGCKEIIDSVTCNFDHICCPCGTGTTIAGIIGSLKNDQKAIGFQVLKSKNYIKNEVVNWLDKSCTSSQNWHVEEDYHFGGYAKINKELTDFMLRFKETNNIPLDYVYTGKMMFGIYDLMEKEFFKKGQTVIAIHTGGLQGNPGFEK